MRLYLQAKRGDLRPFFMPERLYIPIRAGFAAYGAENDMCPPQGFKRCLTGISNAIFINGCAKCVHLNFRPKYQKYALDGLMGGLMDDIFIEVCPHIIKK